MDTVVGVVIFGGAAWFALARWRKLTVEHRARRIEQERLDKLYRPFYERDVVRSDVPLLTPEECQARASRHYQNIDQEYRRRGSSGDEYWNRPKELDRNPGYAEWLAQQPHGERIRAWYREPETLFALAQRVLSEKDPRDLVAERAVLETAVPERAEHDFWDKWKTEHQGSKPQQRSG